MAVATALTGSSSVRATVCRSASVNDAFAFGDATALVIRQSLVNLTLPSPTTSSSQHGPGHTAHSDSGPVFLYPADGSIASVGTMQVTADSTVAGDRLRADQVSTANLADVSLLGGMVRVNLVKAQGHSIATDQMADMSGAGSTLVSATVNGVAYGAVYPNLKVPLPASQFGAGSYVVLYERKDTGLFPDQTHPNYVSDQTIRMVHVFVRDANPIVPGDQNLEVVAGQTHTHAEAPTAYCGGLQNVSANADLVKVKPAGQPEIMVGHATIPDTGGESHNSIAAVSIPVGDYVVRASTGDAVASGRIYPGSWDVSYDMSQVGEVCIGPSSGGCDISAQLVRAESNSVADWHKADSWGGVKIVHLVVAGVNVCQTLGLQDTCTPPANTKVTIGTYTVVLNERTYDGRASSCLGHTGQTSVAVHISGPTIGSVMLAKAYSAATYC